MLLAKTQGPKELATWPLSMLRRGPFLAFTQGKRAWPKNKLLAVFGLFGTLPEGFAIRLFSIPNRKAACYGGICGVFLRKHIATQSVANLLRDQTMNL